MKQKRHNVEEIIRILREVDGGKNVESVCREHNVMATSYYQWKKKYGGMELQDAKRYLPRSSWKGLCLRVIF